MFLPAFDQRFAFFEDLVGAPKMGLGKLIIHVAGVLRDAPADTDFISGTAHLVGIRPTRFEETRGPDADHRRVTYESAVINVLGLQAAFEGNQIALPARATLMRRFPDAAKELLGRVIVRASQPGHRG